MKNFLIIFALLVFITGCGNDQAKTNKTPLIKKSEDHITLGMQYLQNQDVPRAIQQFDAAIKQDPTNVDNYLVLGQVYTKLKLYERAIDTFSAATKVAPTSGEAQYLLATSRALDGRTDEAIQATQRSIELFMASKDEQNFKKSVSLLKGLTDFTDSAVEAAAPKAGQ